MKSEISILTGLLLASSVGGASGQTLPINCTIKPSEVIEISPVIGGVVAELFVARGDEVKQGEPILRLDDDLALAEQRISENRAAMTAGLAAAQAEIKFLSKQVKRLRKAFEKDAIALSELEDAELRLELAQANETRQEQELAVVNAEAERSQIQAGKSIVYSPKGGIVGEDLASIGESVTGQVVATLTVTDPLRLEAFVPTELLEKIDDASLQIADRKIKSSDYSIDYVAPTANLSSGTISIFFHLQKDTAIPGERCQFIFEKS